MRIQVAISLTVEVDTDEWAKANSIPNDPRSVRADVRDYIRGLDLSGGVFAPEITNVTVVGP